MRKLLILSLAVVIAMATSAAQAKVIDSDVTVGKKHNKRCDLRQSKSYIVTKRNKTWDWQTKLFMPRTPTSYTERTNNGCAYLKWDGTRWAKRANKWFHEYVSLRNPRRAICFVFKNYCQEALSVSWCESHYHITAQNGQYLGLFQMGSHERELYGHSLTALGQAWSAKKYFVDTGRDWSPWSCKP